MVTKRTDYTAEAVEAARSVILELTHLLGEYRDSIVIVGGWVPQLLIDHAPREHVGSLDVDIALNHRTLQEVGYKSILQLLIARDYRPSEQPYVFFRAVSIGERTYEVEIDFLAGEYSGTTRGHRTQKVQDLRPRKARGCDLAVDFATVTTLTGTLPGGGLDTVSIRVASIVPFLVMKAMALAGRMMEKDAWDIYYCIRYYPGGIDRLVEEFKPHLRHGLVHWKLSFLEFLVIRLHFNIVRIEFRASRLDRKLPVDFDMRGISLLDQGHDLFFQPIKGWNATVQAQPS